MENIEKNHIKQQQADHDLLIRIDQKLGDLIDDVDEMKTNIVGRVNMLEENKLDKSEFKEFVKEIDSLKKWKWTLAGGIAVLSALVVPVILGYFK